MIKILVILGVIFGVFLLGISIFLRVLKNFLGIGGSIKTRNINFDNNYNNNDKDVLYQKNDVVVLKGDAKSK
ncbi:MAG: hypothetical protein RO257_07735 [Candidatus Kapabacteria bacterium]|nr:hypothetical protein [Candidatus Kapabacteria bacterium]